MMLTTEALKLLGRTALLRDTTAAGLAFEVSIVDVKQSYGATRVLIEPKHGAGRAWVGIERLNFGGV